MDSSSEKGPFGFRLQSSSPVVGCLFTMFALIVGLAVALIGFFAALIMPLVMLIIRLTRRAMANPAADQVRQSDVEAIDVESTVLTPEAERHE